MRGLYRQVGQWVNKQDHREVSVDALDVLKVSLNTSQWSASTLDFK